MRNSLLELLPLGYLFINMRLPNTKRLGEAHVAHPAYDLLHLKGRSASLYYSVVPGTEHS